MRRSSLIGLMASVLLVLSACGGGNATPAQEELVGLFRITAGACNDAGATGSYFRMVQADGDTESGPFVSNNDSACDDRTFTTLVAGSDGGLVTGSYQPHPDPAFESVHAVASLLAQPTSWFGIKFALATNPKDPQAETEVAAPKITLSDGKLSGDLRSFAAAWNGLHFNQGSPKPDGSKPGNTSGPTGDYDPSTKKFTLAWTSQIVGGAFNNFTGTWHLEGVFEAKSG